MTKYNNQDLFEEKQVSGAVSEQPEQDIPVEKLSDSAFYRMYLNEIRSRRVVPEAELQELYVRLLSGDSHVAAEIVDCWLMRIVEMAKLYMDTPVNMEDVIQEGNVGLWVALKEREDDLELEQMEEYLVGRVRDAIESYIRKTTGEIDQEQSVIGKAALLYSAREHLAKENGQVPSNEQLSQFTHIPVEEVEDILALLKGQDEA